MGNMSDKEHMIYLAEEIVERLKNEPFEEYTTLKQVHCDLCILATRIQDYIFQQTR